MALPSDPLPAFGSAPLIWGDAPQCLTMDHLKTQKPLTTGYDELERRNATKDAKEILAAVCTTMPGFIPERFPIPQDPPEKCRRYCPDWREIITPPHTEPFYFNTRTGVVQWVDPALEHLADRMEEERESLKKDEAQVRAQLVVEEDSGWKAISTSGEQEAKAIVESIQWVETHELELFSGAASMEHDDLQQREERVCSVDIRGRKEIEGLYERHHRYEYMFSTHDAHPVYMRHTEPFLYLFWMESMGAWVITEKWNARLESEVLARSLQHGYLRPADVMSWEVVATHEEVLNLRIVERECHGDLAVESGQPSNEQWTSAVIPRE